MIAGRWPLEAAWRRDRIAFLAAGLVFLSILIGGGGVEAPLRNAIIESGGALLLVACAAFHFGKRPLPSEAAGPLWLLAATLLVIALQLVPLPPATWTQLPGRETAVAVSGAAGLDIWRPLSLDPEATRRFGAALLLPAGLVLATLMSDNRGLLTIARAIVAGALLSALLAAAQISMGTPQSLAPFGHVEKGAGSGLLVNPNHQATLMALALVVTGLLIRMEPPQVRIRRRHGEWRFHLGWLLFPLFALMAVGSQSRAGIVLLVPAVLAGIVIALNPKGAARLFALAVALLASAVAVLASSGDAWKRLMDLQSSLTAEGRVVSMPDILYTLGQYWPAGSGFGTFNPVFRANENLDLVVERYLNRAHNEYLELLIEGGLAAAFLLAFAALLLVLGLVRLVRMPRRAGNPAPALAGLAMIVILMLHSIVDFPLRIDSIAAVAAVAVAFFFSPAQAGADARSSGKRSRGRKGFSDPLAGLVGGRGRSGTES